MYTPTRPTRPRVLLTGFDAFGGDAVNPSWLAVRALHGRQMAGHAVVAAQLPTVFGEALRELHALLVKHQPALVICVGQAGGRRAATGGESRLPCTSATLAAQ